MAGHAGTLPMGMRRDPLAAASEMILAIEACAKASEDLVATVGRLSIPGAAVNVVPGYCTFSLDVRAPSDATRRRAMTEIRAAIAQIAARRHVEAFVDMSYKADATPCDARLSAALAASVTRMGYDIFRLPSGAGHDGMAFREVLPIAMLFVRCKGGISHNPAEYATAKDIGVAARVLYDFVTTLA
jgi:allantoate deiminase